MPWATIRAPTTAALVSLSIGHWGRHRACSVSADLQAVDAEPRCHTSLCYCSGWLRAESTSGALRTHHIGMCNGSAQRRLPPHFCRVGCALVVLNDLHCHYGALPPRLYSRRDLPGGRCVGLLRVSPKRAKAACRLDALAAASRGQSTTDTYLENPAIGPLAKHGPHLYALQGGIAALHQQLRDGRADLLGLHLGTCAHGCFAFQAAGLGMRGSCTTL